MVFYCIYLVSFSSDWKWHFFGRIISILFFAKRWWNRNSDTCKCDMLCTKYVARIVQFPVKMLVWTNQKWHFEFQFNTFIFKFVLLVSGISYACSQTTTIWNVKKNASGINIRIISFFSRLFYIRLRFGKFGMPMWTVENSAEMVIIADLCQSQNDEYARK